MYDPFAPRQQPGMMQIMGSPNAIDPGRQMPRFDESFGQMPTDFGMEQFGQNQWQGRQGGTNILGAVRAGQQRRQDFQQRFQPNGYMNRGNALGGIAQPVQQNQAFAPQPMVQPPQQVHTAPFQYGKMWG